MMTPWAGAPAPDPLRIVILGALAYTVLAYRDHGTCADCQPGAECPDHAGDDAAAATYENAYMQVASGTTAWCHLKI